MDSVDAENSFVQNMWQHPPSFVHLDLLSSKGSPQLSPLFQDSHPKGFLLSSPEPLLTLLSLNRNSPGSPAGAPPMCFMPILEDNGQDYVEPTRTQRHGGSTKHWPVGTKPLSSEQSQCPSRKNNALNHTWVGAVEEMEEGLMIQSLWHLSQHVSLANRAGCLQQRVLAVLGEHASRHYCQQLDGLKKKLLEARCFPKYSMTSDPLFETAQVDQALRRNFQFTQTHKQPLKSRHVQNFAHSGHAVLQGLLESLDSDATASSSDEEGDHEDTKATSDLPHCDVCEVRWLKERAEICSRWTRMQMRLSELDSQIQRIEKLYRQILANKSRVVLAECQPLTDQQIQHTLWTETMDLSFTAGNMRDLHSDLEMEPSSPTRLLRNIERQSAQLTQIVNSLMPSFCASPSSSPLSKGPCNRWRDQQKTAFNSEPQCLPKAKKRKRTCQRRQYVPQVAASFMSARTRPLLNYHKPRLFLMDPLSHREQVFDFSSSDSPKCASCDPTLVSAHPACSRIQESADGKVHPFLSLSSEMPSSFHLQNALFEESVLQRSLLLKTELSSPHHCLRPRGRVSRSLFQCSHGTKNKGHLKRQRQESTPIRWAGARDHHSHSYRESKRRLHYSERPTGMQVSSVTPQPYLVSQSDDSHVEEPLEDVNISYCTPSQQRNSQLSFRRRNWDSIDNIVIPMSLFSSVNVEKLQYKNILTPSWRKLNISPLLKREHDEQEEKLSEAIEDVDFFQRHQIYERSEKLHWSCWEEDSQSIRSSRRSCSSVCVRNHPAHCHSPAHSPDPSTFSSLGDLEDDIETLPPWKRRTFPLADEDEETLRLQDHQSTKSEIHQEMTSY
ncbi:KAT8 regulatory NSL complex subunit 1-like protein isoform X2 [Danio aesculapii]|uniref:KAT8 regulatory NSL complex subunit 1-like protein isoform X2 n=1 Tax=Danio aesculapii TaxID=1142201 RepID=UPI0024BFB339|nr:KAT8 regulatory NSL complex subunit 1-like protein isoform X2 [Danio aesculapii]